MDKKVIIVGGGVAGMQAAVTLSGLGIKPLIVERGEKLGGKLNQWHKLFPSMTYAENVVHDLADRVKNHNIEVITNGNVTEVYSNSITLSDQTCIDGDAVIIASGSDIFDARLKEEYGYGIYDNVYTSVDLERMFNQGKVVTKSGAQPSRIALLHCVGSRDAKVDQNHCSRVCCITGVKQAIELKQMFPKIDVYNFYMDIRMFGPGYEEIYRQAQQDYNIHFIRGRISEASETIDKRIQIKAEDTLIGRPMRLSVDMLILVVGMTACAGNKSFAANPDIKLYPSGFINPSNLFINNTGSDSPSIFYAGTVTAPKSVGESLNEGTAAAMNAYDYLKTL